MINTRLLKKAAAIFTLQEKVPKLILFDDLNSVTPSKFAQMQLYWGGVG